MQPKGTDGSDVLIEEKDLLIGLDAVIRETENAQLTASQALHLVKMRSLQEALEFYRSEAKTMSATALGTEAHDSQRLGRHLTAAGKPRPGDHYEAHAIVSGEHKHARAARVILARYRIRIDDPDNGAWLPNFKRNTPAPAMPGAPAHRTIHTQQYYLNITSLLSQVTTERQARQLLQQIGRRLQEGTFPYKKGDKINPANW